jgi:hypothetical protein
MNYIRELNAFWDWALVERPSTGQVALCLALMSIDNKTGWQGSFTAPNLMLQLMTGLSRQGLDKARSALCSKGRLRYRKGRSNQAGVYDRIPFYTDYQKVGTEVGTQDESKVSDSQESGSDSKKVGTEVGTAGVDCQKVGTAGVKQLSQQLRASRHSSGTLFKQNKTDQDLLDPDHDHNPPIVPPLAPEDREQFIREYEAATGKRLVPCCPEEEPTP